MSDGGYAAAVREFVLAHIGHRLAAYDLSPETIPDDFDLLTEGVIDSLGLLQLVAALDSEFGVEIDFEDLDPEQLTRLGPFSRYVEDQLIKLKGEDSGGVPQ
jgi:acyl carrier protein